MDREPRGGGPASPAAPANLHEVDCGLMAGLPAERFSTWRALSFSQTGACAETRGMGKAQGNWLLFLQFPDGAGRRDGFRRPSRQRSLSGKVLVTSR